MSEIKKETVLVTGATGFLGEYLVRRFVPGYRVLALGRNREQGAYLEKLGAVFCQGDFTDETICDAYFRNITYVIHAGALSSTWGKWEDFYNTNVLGTDTVARLCLKHGVKRLVHVSSPSIYTEKHDQYDIREDQAPMQNELNYYIKSKLLAEWKLKEWNKKGLETVVIRPRGLIGIGDTSLVPRLLRANSKVGIPLFNNGRNLVDLTSVENVALACQLAMTAAGVNGEVFNITNGEPTPFKELLEEFLAAIDESPHYLNLPFQLVYHSAAALERIYHTLHLPGEPLLTRYTVSTLGFAQTMDISKVRRLLGYQPEKTLSEAIEEYGVWWRSKNQSAATKPEQVEIISGSKQIVSVKLYHCGFCTNNLKLVFRNRKWEKRKFPATAVLIQHKQYGPLLFDTGYSKAIFREGFLPRLYRIMNPVSLEPGQMIDEKLKQDGINPVEIKSIILSHAHPDHIGGRTRFQDYELIATAKVLDTIKHPGIRDLVFPGMVPDGTVIRQAKPLEGQLTDHFLSQYFDQVYDVFGDGSILGVVLEGHSKGQLGIWIPDYKLFLAADAGWGNDLISSTPHMRILPRLIQQNFSAYQDTLRRLCRLKRDYPQIRIVFTHQRGKERTYE